MEVSKDKLRGHVRRLVKNTLLLVVIVLLIGVGIGIALVHEPASGSEEDDGRITAVAASNATGSVEGLAGTGSESAFWASRAPAIVAAAAAHFPILRVARGRLFPKTGIRRSDLHPGGWRQRRA